MTSTRRAFNGLIGTFGGGFGLFTGGTFAMFDRGLLLVLRGGVNALLLSFFIGLIKRFDYLYILLKEMNGATRSLGLRVNNGLYGLVRLLLNFAKRAYGGN